MDVQHQSEIEDKPWERQPEEPLKHYEWFHAFLMLGPSRSVVGAFNAVQAKKGKEKQSQAHGAWNAAAIKWHWKERVALWDAEQRRLEEEEFAERRRKMKNRLFGIAEKMADKTEMMLAFPVATPQISPNGQTTIEPGKWNFNTVPRLTAAIERLTKEDENKTEISVKSKGGSVLASARGAGQGGAVVIILPDNGRTQINIEGEDGDEDDDPTN